MLLEVSHRTTYTYSDPVVLGPHRLRLTPRPTVHQELLHHSLEVVPGPAHSSRDTDPEGNRVTHLHFEGPTASLSVHTRFAMRIRTPDPLATTGAGEPPRDGGATLSPEPYGPPLRDRLSPWIRQDASDPPVRDLAITLRQHAGDSMALPHLVNAWLHDHIAREIRLSGAAHSPGETLRLGRGSCRDLTVLFIALCREMGFAARFASGYQPHASTRRKERFLHAWPEVYLRSKGWVGFDPTHGQAGCDDHVAVAVARDPDGAAPIIGSYSGSATSTMHVDLSIKVVDGSPPA
jgi:transglutaminase-like putative cysteine protease